MRSIYAIRLYVFGSTYLALRIRLQWMGKCLEYARSVWINEAWIKEALPSPNRQTYQRTGGDD